jgi:hypothetical protein
MLFWTIVAIDRSAAPYSFNSPPCFLDQALGKHRNIQLMAALRCSVDLSYGSIERIQ